AALLGATPSINDQLAQALVSGLVLGQQDQPGAGLYPHFAADNQGDVMRLGGLPGADYAGQGALVGNGQRLIAVLSGTGKELVGAGGAPMEAEVAQAMQFGVVGCHANHPCSIQG